MYKRFDHFVMILYNVCCDGGEPKTSKQNPSYLSEIMLFLAISMEFSFFFGLIG